MIQNALEENDIQTRQQFASVLKGKQSNKSVINEKIFEEEKKHEDPTNSGYN